MSTKEINISQILEEVYDPEVPVLSVIDLGVIRNIEVDNEKVIITITPTYSGCPAMDVITMNIRMALLEHCYRNAEIKTILSPAWTTDWMTEEGKKKLAAYGIGPPNPSIARVAADGVECPHCHSHKTKLLSEFGSTACKALFQCSDCKEPFDYFKCH